jgi:uncharacterized protein (DUF302 family)
MPQGIETPGIITPGIITKESLYSVEETIARLQSTLAEKHIKLFAIVDHSGEAAAAGLHMPPTKLLIFGNPQAGTPVMLAAPSTALDLPLKILVAEDAHGKIHLSWNDPSYLKQRHNFPEELTKNLAAAEALTKPFQANP